MEGYRHYIRTNAEGIIVHGFSDAFEQPQEGDILISDGATRQFHLTWPEPLINEHGQLRYRWQDGQRVERSAEELAAEWNNKPTAPPTMEERIAMLEQLELERMLGGM